MGLATESKVDGGVGNKTRAEKRLGVKQVKYEDNVDRECDPRGRRGRWGIVTGVNESDTHLQDSLRSAIDGMNHSQYLQEEPGSSKTMR